MCGRARLAGALCQHCEQTKNFETPNPARDASNARRHFSPIKRSLKVRRCSARIAESKQSARRAPYCYHTTAAISGRIFAYVRRRPHDVTRRSRAKNAELYLGQRRVNDQEVARPFGEEQLDEGGLVPVRVHHDAAGRVEVVGVDHFGPEPAVETILGKKQVSVFTFARWLAFTCWCCSQKLAGCFSTQTSTKRIQYCQNGSSIIKKWIQHRKARIRNYTVTRKPTRTVNYQNKRFC